MVARSKLMIQPSNRSRLELIASLSPSERRRLLGPLTDAQAKQIEWSWDWSGRPNQLLPGTPRAAIQRRDWIFWLALAGRGWGKTRVGSETVRQWALSPRERILMIAPTTNDVRATMMEGPSGLLSCYPADQRPIYQPTRHRVLFPSGAVGITVSAEEPDRIRGQQFTKFWFDELAAAKRHQEAWDQVMFAFRLKTKNLQGLITTTPKPLKLLKELVHSTDTVVTRGSSYENRTNLNELYYRKVIAPYEGTRLGRQEIHAEILEDVPGALWTRARIEDCRLKELMRHDQFVRIVIAIDPAVSHDESSDETGILVCALVRSGHVLVLEDASGKYSAADWARIAVHLLRKWRADRIVGEVNNGGDLVARNIFAYDSSVPFRAVRASRGKYMRAEPVAALYERGLVHHTIQCNSSETDLRVHQGCLCQLEEQMVSWTPLGDQKSPDRLDALVWGVTDLVVDPEEISQQVDFSQPYQISAI